MTNEQEIQKLDKQTCLYDKHVALGALMSPFGGFIMPIQYSGIAEEHQAVRQRVGVFDVSHMGEVSVRGRDAESYVQHIFTNDIAGAPTGKIYYGMMCYENGGTVDDLLVYKMGDNDFFLVINAANIDKDWAWMQQHAQGFDIDLRNRSDDYGQIAVQGPEAERTVEQVLGLACSELTFYTVKSVGDVIISRTGYTGEDGFEIYASHDYIRQCWDKLVEAGVQPCGLGCRDTLRFEVGLPLYGDELDEEHTPVESGMGRMMKSTADFVGRKGLDTVREYLIPLELEGRRSARHGDKLTLTNGTEVGRVTSGTFAPSLGKAIAFAWVQADKANENDFLIQTGRASLKAHRTEIPFYKDGTARRKLQ